MSSLVQELVDEIETLRQQVQVAPVRRFMLAPEPRPSGRRNNFAYLELEDGSIGLTYVALDGAHDALIARQSSLVERGTDAYELVPHYLADAGWQRALGLAAINAIAQGEFRRRSHQSAKSPRPDDMPDNLSLLTTRPGTRVGMVGYFGRLVEPLRQQGVKLTVIELDDQLHRQEAGLEVTGNIASLDGCDQVIITGTTLLNHSLEAVLDHCRAANRVLLLGPSASCLPEVPFAHGVDAIGGFQVTDPVLFQERWAAGGRWRDAGRRTILWRSTTRL